MTDYVYAPKDDPKHRAEWRVPYDDAELDGFARFADAGALRLGFGISPGLSIDADVDRRPRRARRQGRPGRRRPAPAWWCSASTTSPSAAASRARPTRRLAAVAGRPPRRPGRAGPGAHRVRRHPPHAVPRRARRAALPDDVPIGWTGDAVVNDAITAAQARRRAEALGGRPPLVWDNVPVNDGLMADRLHLGPLWGRDAGLLDDGASPAGSPTRWCSRRRRCCRWRRSRRGCRGEDPLDAWAAEADRRGLAGVRRGVRRRRARRPRGARRRGDRRRQAAARRPRRAARVVRRRRRRAPRPASRRSAPAGSSRCAPRRRSPSPPSTSSRPPSPTTRRGRRHRSWSTDLRARLPVEGAAARRACR